MEKPFFHLVIVTFFILPSNLFGEIVTPSLISKNYTINPSATAFRTKGIYSSELIYDKYILSKSDVAREDVEWPTPSIIEINLLKLTNIFANNYGPFVPELYVSLEKGDVEEKDFIYPSNYVDGLGQTFDGKVSAFHSHFNLGIKLSTNISIGIRQFYARFKAKYVTEYDYSTFGTGHEEGETSDSLNGQAIGSTIAITDDFYIGAMYFNSKKHSNSKNTYSDDLGNSNNKTENSVVKIIQYAYGLAYQNEFSGKDRILFELYRLKQKTRETYKKWNVENGKLDKIILGASLKGFLLGINASRYKGDYVDIYRLTDSFFFTLYPTNDYTYKYGANIGFDSGEGLSISFSGMYTSGKITQTYYLNDPDDGSLKSYSNKKNIKHYSYGISVSYIF